MHYYRAFLMSKQKKAPSTTPLTIRDAVEHIEQDQDALAQLVDKLSNTVLQNHDLAKQKFDKMVQETTHSRQENKQTIDALRSSISSVESELKLATTRIDKAHEELRRNTSVKLASVQGDVSSASNEVTSLKSMAMAIEASIVNFQSTQDDHASNLKDVAVMKAQLEHLQSSSNRAEQQIKDVAIVKTQLELINSSVNRLEQRQIEQERQIQELRSELGALQQRHVALDSRTNAEQSSLSMQFGEMRSTTEDSKFKIEKLDACMLKAQNDHSDAVGDIERLKKAARRHELLIKQVGETADSKNNELRGLIRAIAEHLQPMQDETKQNSARIEELSAALNKVVDILKGTYYDIGRGNEAQMNFRSPNYSDILNEFRSQGRL